jgi:hypothetical protein
MKRQHFLVFPRSEVSDRQLRYFFPVFKIGAFLPTSAS